MKAGEIAEWETNRIEIQVTENYWEAKNTSITSEKERERRIKTETRKVKENKNGNKKTH
jgi:hypothetical protein